MKMWIYLIIPRFCLPSIETETDIKSYRKRGHCTRTSHSDLKLPQKGRTDDLIPRSKAQSSFYEQMSPDYCSATPLVLGPSGVSLRLPSPRSCHRDGRKRKNKGEEPENSSMEMGETCARWRSLTITDHNHLGPLKLKLRGTVLVIGLERRQSGEKEDEVCLHATLWASPFVLQRILLLVTFL